MSRKLCFDYLVWYVAVCVTILTDFTFALPRSRINSDNDRKRNILGHINTPYYEQFEMRHHHSRGLRNKRWVGGEDMGFRSDSPPKLAIAMPPPEVHIQIAMLEVAILEVPQPPSIDSTIPTTHLPTTASNS